MNHFDGAPKIKGYLKERNTKPRESEMAFRNIIPIAAHNKKTVSQKSFTLGPSAYCCNTEQEFTAYVLNRNENSRLKVVLRSNDKDKIQYERIFRRDFGKAHERSEKLYESVSNCLQNECTQQLLIRRASMPALYRHNSVSAIGVRFGGISPSLNHQRCASAGFLSTPNSDEISNRGNTTSTLPAISPVRPATSNGDLRHTQPERNKQKRSFFPESKADAGPIKGELDEPKETKVLFNTITFSKKNKNASSTNTSWNKNKVKKKIKDPISQKVDDFLEGHKAFIDASAIPKDILRKTEESCFKARTLVSDEFKMTSLEREARKKLGLNKVKRW